MPARPVIDDLFGHVPQARAAQPDLADTAGPEDWRLPREADYLVPTPPAPNGGHTPDSIRAQVMKVMAVVRDAEAMPFGAAELHTHTVWMPYLCEWLKGGEGDALLAEFREHLERLKLAA
jgi:hypothetical protein